MRDLNAGMALYRIGFPHVSTGFRRVGIHFFYIFFFFFVELIFWYSEERVAFMYFTEL